MNAPTTQTIILITGRMGSGKTAALRDTQTGAHSAGVSTVELAFEVSRAPTPYLRTVAQDAPQGALVLFDDGTPEDLNRIVGLASLRPDLYFALAYEVDSDLTERTLYAA